MKPLDLGLMELRAALDARTLSSRELTAAALERIDALNPSRNAIVACVDADAALTAADSRDQTLATAAKDRDAASLRRRMLLGIPQATKDTTASRDIVTTWGSPLHAGFLPPADHVVVARAREAGAVFLGKTNVPEFGYGSHSFNTVYGVTGNAHDPGLTAGGSSGGAAVAVATGMLAVADGSDVMGSLRNPAGFNRILGMRPTTGLVPNAPAPEGFLHTLGSCGPMARNVADLAALLSVQAGHDRRDPRSLPGDGTPFADLAIELASGEARDPADWLVRSATRADAGRAGSGQGVRIGWLADLGGHLAMAPGILDACGAALAVFDGLGARTEAATLAMAPDAIWQSWLTARSFFISGIQAELYADPARREQMKPEAVWEIERGLGLSALEAHRASVVRTTFLQRWLELFDRHDFIALPTAQVLPFPADIRWPAQIGTRKMDTYHRWMEVVLYPTLAGSPAISLPVPGSELIGLQLIGPPGADRKVLEAAAAYQLATVGPRGWIEGLAIAA